MDLVFYGGGGAFSGEILRATHRNVVYIVFSTRLFSGADSPMSSRYIYIFRSRNCLCSCVGVRVYLFSYALARAG